MASITGVAANEDEMLIFRLNPGADVVVPEWKTINHNYSPWGNSSTPSGCGAWTPSVESIDWGESFQQSRSCSQAQNRVAIPVLLNPIIQTTKPGKQFSENRTITISQYQNSIGKRDFIASQRADSFSGWINQGSHYGCGEWSPSPETVTLYESFGQERTCSQKQRRTAQVYNVWASGKETPLRVDSEDRVIDSDESRMSQGTLDKVNGQRIGGWSQWRNTNGNVLVRCSQWTPSPNTVNLNDEFSQRSTCQLDQDSERNIYDVWISGKETLNKTETRTQAPDVLRFQRAVGTKDYIKGTTEGAWSSYVNSGGVSGCSGWSPAPSTVNLGASFTQSRSCQQGQVRSRTIYNVWESGKQTFNSSESSSRTVSITQNQSSIGTKDYITGTSYGSWSGYNNSGSVTGCSGWSPSPSTVNLGQSFTQNRTCSQAQSRTRSIYNVWASGKTTSKGTDYGSRTISVNQTNGAQGTKNYVTGTSSGGWSGWSNSGGKYSCGGYSPATSTVNYGQTFTQTGSCKQNQTRSRTIYNVWANGSKTAKSTESGSQTINVSNTRSATGTKNYATGSQSVYGGWVSNGSKTCGGYSPSTSTVNWGTSFTQTSSCTQPYKRSVTLVTTYANGAKVNTSKPNETKTVSSTQSRTVTGTKDFITKYTFGGWSSWSNSGGVYSCGSYSPPANVMPQGIPFNQTASCKQDQKRTRSVYNFYLSGKTTFRRTDVGTQTVDATSTRRTYGTWSQNCNNGSYYDQICDEP